MRHLVCIAHDPVVSRKGNTEVDKTVGRMFEILEGVGYPTPFHLQDRYVNEETAMFLVTDEKSRQDWQIVATAEVEELKRIARL